MLKEHKSKLIVSSLITLLPIVFGLIMWDKLPEFMPIHWGISGTADGMSGRGFAVFVMPLIMLAVHWFCLFFTAKDRKNKGQNRKVFGLMFWIIPCISLIMNGMLYSVAFGWEPNPLIFINIVLGALFIVIGNYLPKCKQNLTIGLKFKWTLENEENWNATHRIGGKVFVCGGFVMLAGIFFGKLAVAVMMISAAALVLIPLFYSYAYHKKQVREGTAVITPIRSTKEGKKVTRGSLITLAAILILVALLMFTGSIDIVYGEDAFTVDASMWSDLTVNYDAVDAIEYRETDDPGSRTAGFGSAKLLAGSFRNNEFGAYTRYSFTSCRSCVVLTVGGKTLVINAADDAGTRAIYETLLEKTN